MIDEPRAALGLGDVVDLLRDDGAAAELRSQRLLEALEGRVMAAIVTLRSDMDKGWATHGADHLAQRTESELAHKRFDSYVAGATLDAARRDGALGMVRLVIDTFGRNWKAIAAGAGLVLAATGGVHISIGV